MDTGSTQRKRFCSRFYARITIFSYVKSLHIFPAVIIGFGSAHIWEIVRTSSQILGQILPGIKWLYGYAFVALPQQRIIRGFPQIFANGSASTNQAVFGAFPPQKFDALRITGDLQWELDFWGGIRRSVQAAKFDAQAQEEDRKAVVLTLVSDVATAYIELRELDDDLAKIGRAHV